MNTVEKPKHILIPILICLVASSFYIYDYLLRVMPQGLANELMHSFNIHAGKLGILSSLFFWGYAPMQIPCGILYDRFSARKILTIATFIAALTALGFGFSYSFVLASFFRFMMGFMSSFAFVGALVVGAYWFRGQYFAFYSGLVQFLGCIGAILGITPIVVLAHYTGWRAAHFWVAILGFFMAILIWVFVKDAPHKPTEITATHLGKAYKKAFAHGQTWWVALYGFAIWGPITIFASFWGVSYYAESYYGFSKIVAGNFISIIWWTIAFGGPLVGLISKYFKTRRWPMIACSSIGLLSSLAVLLFPTTSSFVICALLIAYGIGSSGLVLAFGLVVDLHPPEAVGAVVGFTNMSVIFGGLLLIPTVGFILQHLWTGTQVLGVPLYSHHAFKMALLVLPGCFLLALFASLFVKETHCEKLHIY